MDRLTGWVLGHRRWVVIAWLAVTVAGMWAAATITDSLSQSFDAPGRPAFDANREIVRTFGSGGVVPPLVLVGPRGDLGRVARAVPGARVALPRDRTLVAGQTAAALVFPPPGRPAPDTNPQALAAATRAAAGTGVGVTGSRGSRCSPSWWGSPRRSTRAARRWTRRRAAGAPARR
jgi:RND superfamily putative drug exporter